MEIAVTQMHGQVPVTVLMLHGDLDAASYLELIERARQVYQGGSRHVLIDMRDLRFLSSSGLLALHSIALLARGHEPPAPAHDWNSLPEIGESVDRFVRLLSPQARVLRTLQLSGMSRFFAIDTDLERAVAAFS